MAAHGWHGPDDDEWIEGNLAVDAVAWLLTIAMIARTEIVVANRFGPGLGA